MRIELLETVLHDGLRFDEGDVRTVNDITGGYFCENGWAKDLDGKVATVPRDTSKSVKLDVANVSHATTSRVK